MKKFLSAAIAILLIFSACASVDGGVTEETSNTAGENMYQGCVNLNLPLMIYTNEPIDLQLVNDEINKITREKINVTVTIYTLGFATKNSEMNVLKNEGVNFDLSFSLISNWHNYIAIDTLAAEYASEALDLFTESELDYFRRDGLLYGLPSKIDRAQAYCICMRKDLLDKYGIDYTAMKTLDDFDRAAEIISQNEPDMAMIAPNETDKSFLNRASTWDAIAGSTYVLMDGGQSKTVEILYETEEYKNLVTHFYNWNMKGYFPEEMKMDTLRSSRLVADGSLFAYIYPYKPGVAVEESLNCHREMVCLLLNEPFVTTSNYTRYYWGITKDCKDPVAAMKLLNLMFTDPDIMNLFIYGIEGIHYELKDDGTIGFPPGIDSTNSTYLPNIPWELPNQFIAHVWSGNALTLWADMDHFNKTAAKSNAIGFSFDSSQETEKYRAVNQVANQYISALNRGLVDPETTLPMMIQEMKDAGSDEVKAEVQRQLDEFLAKQIS